MLRARWRPARESVRGAGRARLPARDPRPGPGASAPTASAVGLQRRGEVASRVRPCAVLRAQACRAETRLSTLTRAEQRRSGRRGRARERASPARTCGRELAGADPAARAVGPALIRWREPSGRSLRRRGSRGVRQARERGAGSWPDGRRRRSRRCDRSRGRSDARSAGVDPPERGSLERRRRGGKEPQRSRRPRGVGSVRVSGRDSELRRDTPLPTYFEAPKARRVSPRGRAPARARGAPARGQGRRTAAERRRGPDPKGSGAGAARASAQRRRCAARASVRDSDPEPRARARGAGTPSARASARRGDPPTRTPRHERREPRAPPARAGSGLTRREGPRGPSSRPRMAMTASAVGPASGSARPTRASAAAVTAQRARARRADLLGARKRAGWGPLRARERAGWVSWRARARQRPLRMPTERAEEPRGSRARAVAGRASAREGMCASRGARGDEGPRRGRRRLQRG